MLHACEVLAYSIVLYTYTYLQDRYSVHFNCVMTVDIYGTMA